VSRRTRQTALVTGATGTIGPTLVRALLRSGYDVRALVRPAESPGLLPASVTIFSGDITDAVAVRQAVSGCDVVFHLAAKLHVNDPAPSLRDEYEAVNVAGTRNVVNAAVKNDVRRLVFFSTISVYGPTAGGAIYDEHTPPAPSTLYAKTKLAAEEIALAARRHSGEPLTIVLRLAAVYGPQMKGNYRRLLKALNRGVFVPVGDGQNRRTVVYVDDVARAALLAAQTADAGRIFNVTDGHIHTFQEIVTALCNALERRPPRLHLPASPLGCFLRVTDRAFALIGQYPPVGEVTLAKLLEDVAVRGDRICQELGFQPEVSLDEGWQKTLQAMSQQ
jgi:nucleoside-diphosphate-sugar epimerase